MLAIVIWGNYYWFCPCQGPPLNHTHPGPSEDHTKYQNGLERKTEIGPAIQVAGTNGTTGRVLFSLTLAANPVACFLSKAAWSSVAQQLGRALYPLEFRTQNVLQVKVRPS